MKFKQDVWWNFIAIRIYAIIMINKYLKKGY